MDNASVNETQPTPVKKEQVYQPEDQLQETRPIPVEREERPFAETRPTPVSEASGVVEETSTPEVDQGSGAGDGKGAGESSSSSWKWLALLGILTLAIIGVMSALGGYRSGIYQRDSAGATQVARELARQYELALADMQEKRYDLALQRFQFIIQQDPNFPGVTDKLASVLLELSITATPTLAPTPTLTPTPDLRSVEDLWAQAQQSLAGGDWTAAIDTLLKLRKDAPDFHAVEVDGMLYVALMSRGVDKIKNADLEGGIYDLTLAERFGPLGVEARSYRSWAELYVTGASYWEIDWPKAIEVFAQLWQAAPYLRDASGWTSIDRYRIALVEYGDQLAQSGEWCLAQQQYQAALEVNPDALPRATAVHAEEQCGSGGGGGREDRTPEPPPPEEEATPTAPPEGEPGPTEEAEPTVTTYP
jgi:tetratricopeptide (TPR) repeat protein